MKKIYYLIIIILIGIFSVGIFLTSNNIKSINIIPTIKNGVYGTVQLRTGNCMPIIGSSSCKVSPVSRTIYIRRPASIDDMEAAIYLKNKPELIKQVKSDNNGFYEAELPFGNYSIFVEDEGKEYCNHFGDGACQVYVGNQLTKYDILINHATD